jgi:hypothetical protein
MGESRFNLSTGVTLPIPISLLVSSAHDIRRNLQLNLIVGCYLSLAKDKPEYKAKARNLLDSIPNLLERKKIGGKDLPTEVFIQKKSKYIRVAYNPRTLLTRVPPCSLMLSPHKSQRLFGSRFLQTEARQEGRTGYGE